MDAIIKKYFGGNSKIAISSIEHYAHTGKVSGTFYLGLKEMLTEYTQSLQDKVKELESALTESKLREVRLREGLIDMQDQAWRNGVTSTYVHDTIKALLSSNQADKG